MKDGREAGIPASYYRSRAYSSYSTLFSLIEQSRWVMLNDIRELLYVGVGNGFVPAYLRSQGVEVSTVDINPDLKPDYICDVTELAEGLNGKRFEAVMACEVFEHLPFSSFGVCLRQLSVVAERVLITLPVYRRFAFRFSGALRFGRRERAVGVSLSLPKKILPPGHMWEIGSDAENSLQRVRSMMHDVFDSVSDYRMNLNPYHHVFEIRVRN